MTVYDCIRPVWTVIQFSGIWSSIWHPQSVKVRRLKCFCLKDIKNISLPQPVAFSTSFDQTCPIWGQCFKRSLTDHNTMIHLIEMMICAHVLRKHILPSYPPFFITHFVSWWSVCHRVMKALRIKCKLYHGYLIPYLFVVIQWATKHYLN